MHFRTPAPGLPARRQPLPRHAFPHSCSWLASKAPAVTSSRISVLLLQACQQGASRYLITHSRTPAPGLSARRQPLPRHAFPYSCSRLASKAPAITSSRITILIEQPLAQFENVGYRSSLSSVLVELQVQLEDVDHLRAKDTSLCTGLDLLRQQGGIQPSLLGHSFHLRQHGIHRQMGVQAGG